MSDDEVERGLAVVGAFGGHADIAARRAAVRHVHAAAKVIVPAQIPYAGTWDGRDGYSALLDHVEHTWAKWSEAPEHAELAAVGRRVFREVRFSALLRSTGRTVSMFMTEVFVVDQQQVREIRVFFADPAVIAAG